MDLYHHDQPPFTRWIIENGLLREPFIVIDVGVQGGEHPRWDLLGEQAYVYGFDAIGETIDRLREKGERPHRVYRALALGDEDGEREFHVPDNTYAATFYRFRPMWGGRNGDGEPGPRTIPVRRIDSLFAAGEIPAADHIKTDCEGFDAEVLRGARNYMTQSNVVAVTAETDFLVWPAHKVNSFSEINELMVAQRLLVFDLSYYRRPRPAYVAAREKSPWPPADPMRDAPFLDVGSPRTFDVLFCRDFVAEDINPQAFAPLPVAAPNTDKLIKSMINFELHGLMDCAVEVADHFRGQLAERLDVDQAIMLLVQRPPHARNTADVVECLRMVAALRQAR